MSNGGTSISKYSPSVLKNKKMKKCKKIIIILCRTEFCGYSRMRCRYFFRAELGIYMTIFLVFEFKTNDRLIKFETRVNL